MLPWKVLIVDDDPLVLRIVTKRLTRIPGVSMLTSETGEGGLKILEKEKPDLIILDHLLPDTDGLTLCTTIKGNPELFEIPILFFSSYGEFGFAHSVETAGAIKVIPKTEMTELFLSVERLIARAQKAKDQAAQNLLEKNSPDAKA